MLLKIQKEESNWTPKVTRIGLRRQTVMSRAEILNFLVTDIFWKFEEAMDLSLEKCTPGHSLTTFLSLSGNSQNPWNVHGPPVNTLNTIEPSLWKASFCFELLFTNKVLNKPRRQSPQKEATGNILQACSWLGHWAWNRNHSSLATFENKGLCLILKSLTGRHFP